MTANLMGGDGLIVIVVALVVLVGGSQLPKIARNIGLAGREFRKAQAEAEAEQMARSNGSPEGGSAVSPPPALAASPAVASPAAPAGPAAEAGDSITLTPAQLDALLKAREEQVRHQPDVN